MMETIQTYTAKHEKKFTRMVNQAKLKSFNTAPNISTVMKFPGPVNKLSGLMRKMGTPYGETPPPFLN
jgi:hypothetical protein